MPCAGVRQLVLARIIESTSRQDPLRVLEEAGAWAEESSRQELSKACAAHVAWDQRVVLYDVSTLRCEASQGDVFREPGFSKERRRNRRSPSACSPGRKDSC